MRKHALLDKYMEDPEFALLLTQGELILEVTERICEIMENENISRIELAKRMGKTKGFVSHLLGGGRNLTLKSVGSILFALGYKFEIKPIKIK
jgi:plasmid maintenance system antidote protein VapI